MYVCLANNSKQKVFYSINSGEYFFLAPLRKAYIDCRDLQKINLTLKHGKVSYITKKWIAGKIFHLVLTTEFIFENLSDNDELIISREKIRFCDDAYYDRFFITSKNATLISEKHYISNEEKIRETYKKDKKKDAFWLLFAFIVEPFLLAPFYCGALILIGIILSFFFGFMFFILYSLILYLIVFILNLIEHIFDFCLDKIFIKVSGVKVENLSHYLTNEYILNYYSTPYRQPYYKNDYESE